MNFIFSPIILIISISLAAPSLDLYTCHLPFGTLSSPTIGVWGVLFSSLYFMYHLLTPRIVTALSRYIQYYSSPTIRVWVITLSRLSPYLPTHTECSDQFSHSGTCNFLKCSNNSDCSDSLAAIYPILIFTSHLSTLVSQSIKMIHHDWWVFAKPDAYCLQLLATLIHPWYIRLPCNSGF